MSKELKGTVKEILGTAFSVGCNVNGKSPKDLQDDIDNGTAPVPIGLVDPASTESYASDCLLLDFGMLVLACFWTSAQF